MQVKRINNLEEIANGEFPQSFCIGDLLDAQIDNYETDEQILKIFKDREVLEEAKQKAYVASKYYPGFDPSLMTDEEILDWARKDGE